MVQCISDADDIPIPTWQPPLRSRLVPPWSAWPSSGSSVAQVGYNLAELSQT
jgi:hypothetical protein